MPHELPKTRGQGKDLLLLQLRLGTAEHSCPIPAWELLGHPGEPGPPSTGKMDRSGSAGKACLHGASTEAQNIVLLVWWWFFVFFFVIFFFKT